jgi:hypothetical protein
MPSKHLPPPMTDKLARKIQAMLAIAFLIIALLMLSNVKL